MQELKGEITVSSQLGAGSIFTVSLQTIRSIDQSQTLVTVSGEDL